MAGAPAARGAGGRAAPAAVPFHPLRFAGSVLRDVPPATNAVGQAELLPSRSRAAPMGPARLPRFPFHPSAAGPRCALGARASETLGGAGALRPAPAGRARRPAAPRAILSRSRRSPLGRLPVGRGAGPGRPAPGRGGRAAIVRVPRSGTRGPARGRQRGERTAARAGRPARHEVDDRRGTTRRALLRDRVRSRARPGPHRDRDGRALRRVRAQPGSGRLPGRGGAADASAPRRLVRDRSRPSARPRPAPGARLRYDLEPAAVDRLRLQVASTEEGTIAWSIVEIHLYEAAPAPASGRPPPFARGTRRGDTGR